MKKYQSIGHEVGWNILRQRHILAKVPYCKMRNVGGYYIRVFENITIWQRFNLEILLEESGWGPYFFIL